jgi:hypothetical protein
MLSITVCNSLGTIAPSGFSQTLSLLAAWGAKVNEGSFKLGLGALHYTNRCAPPRSCVPSGGGQCTLFNRSRRTHTHIAGVACNNAIKGVSKRVDV